MEEVERNVTAPDQLSESVTLRSGSNQPAVALSRTPAVSNRNYVCIIPIFIADVKSAIPKFQAPDLHGKGQVTLDRQERWCNLFNPIALRPPMAGYDHRDDLWMIG